jgi:hypothetical protein
MAFVRPIHAFGSDACSEHPIVLSPSDILDDSDPHVRARPSLFEPVVATVRGVVTNTAGAELVEQATNAPGRGRGVKLPKD